MTQLAEAPGLCRIGFDHKGTLLGDGERAVVFASTVETIKW